MKDNILELKSKDLEKYCEFIDKYIVEARKGFASKFGENIPSEAFNASLLVVIYSKMLAYFDGPSEHFIGMMKKSLSIAFEISRQGK